ncbi:MAG: D-alanine--D-alanine ligase family protein [Candidatus Liptonbacteria bacterium]
MSQKMKIAVVFGGRSAEHEVSVQSARNIVRALDPEKYEVVPVGIVKSGEWYLVKKESLLAADKPTISLADIEKESNPLSFGFGESKNLPDVFPCVDVVFAILHGPFGEDGTVQGLFKLADIPFVGPGVLGSAVGMDKDIMKRLLRDAGVPIGKFITLSSGGKINYADVVSRIGSPFFLKPANMGSSVGVHKVKNESEYESSLEDAFQYDRKVVLEEFIPGREIECSVLGNQNPIASVPGEVIARHEFYSYEAKYLDDKGADLKIPAELSPEVVKKVQDVAVKTFQVLCCEGLGRVDCFLKDNGEVLVNEINTLPGFTNISMYPKLWRSSGISDGELLDRLIQLARDRFAEEKKLKITYL